MDVHNAVSRQQYEKAPAARNEGQLGGLPVATLARAVLPASDGKEYKAAAAGTRDLIIDLRT
jgi:hypothetical protein